MWLFSGFVDLGGFLGVKIWLFSCFSFIVDNNSLVLISLFCAIKSIISHDSFIDRFDPFKFIRSIFRLVCDKKNKNV